MKRKADVVMAELWLKGSLLIEERWEDIENPETGEVRQETRYAFPGGKVEEDETEVEAIVREVEEETGIVISADDELVKSAETVQEKPKLVKVFRKLLDPRVTPNEDILLCGPDKVLEFGDKGLLMPYSKIHLDKDFVRKNGA